MSIQERLEIEAENKLKELNRIRGVDSDEEANKERMLHADYTKKTQELAQQRKELEAVKNELDARKVKMDSLQANLDYYYQNHQKEYENMLHYLKNGKDLEGFQPSGENPEEKVPEKDTAKVVSKEDPQLKVLMQKLDEQQKLIEGLRLESGRSNVDKATNTLREKYKIDPKDLPLVVEHATKNFNHSKDYYSNLEDSYKTLSYDAQMERERMIREKEQAKLFSGHDAEGNPIRKTPVESLMEDVKASEGANIFQ